MKLIVGLGNPGKAYENTRHNAGFTCVMQFANEPFVLHKEFEAMLSEETHHGEKVISVLPHTFMNDSGRAVQKIAHFYKIKPADIIVVYDDLDLPLGTIRVRPNGSAGTHNGMKSIIAELGTTDFPRVRIGIESRGTTSPQQQETTDFVLGKCTKEEMPTFSESCTKAVDAIKQLLEKSNS